MSTQKYKYSKTIRRWLIIGLVMLIGQVILGGITRLTGSVCQSHDGISLAELYLL